MKYLTKINNTIALVSTNILGTMWVAYAFILMSILPLIWVDQKDNILYVSNAFQLVFLPMLLVGQNIQGQHAETRAQEDHEAILSELAEIKAMHAILLTIIEVKEPA